MNRIYEALNKNLIVPLLIAGMVPVAIMAAVAVVRAGSALDESRTVADSIIEEKVGTTLAAIRDERKAGIERYFEVIANQVATFSASPTIVQATRDFREAFDTYRSAEGIDAGEIAVMRRTLSGYYSNDFESEFKAQNDGASSTAGASLQSLPPTAVALQHAYISANPNPLGSKDGLDRANGVAIYHRPHAEVHPWVRDYLQRFGYYDIFLVDPGDRRDRLLRLQGARLRDVARGPAPTPNTNFARAFQRANALDGAGRVRLSRTSSRIQPSYAWRRRASSLTPVFDGAREGGRGDLPDAPRSHHRQ